MSCNIPSQKFEFDPYFDKLIKALDILELGVAVEQQCRMVGICKSTRVQLLKVRSQVVDTLSVQELSDHVRGLQSTNGADVLAHGSIIVALVV